MEFFQKYIVYFHFLLIIPYKFLHVTCQLAISAFSWFIYNQIIQKIHFRPTPWHKCLKTDLEQVRFVAAFAHVAWVANVKSRIALVLRYDA